MEAGAAFPAQAEAWQPCCELCEPGSFTMGQALEPATCVIVCESSTSPLFCFGLFPSSASKQLIGSQSQLVWYHRSPAK